MPKSAAPEAARVLPVPFDHLVDLLGFLRSLRGNPELVGYLEPDKAVHWTCRRIHQLTGIRYLDLLETVDRLALAENDPVIGMLDGWPERPEFGPYGAARIDLTHVAAGLRELDKDRTTKGMLWRALCKKWPILAEALARALSERQPKANDAPATDSAETNPAALAAKTNKTHVDGPEGGRWLWWKNVRCDVPKGTVYRLLEYMWARDVASYEALDDAKVFDSAVAPQTVRSYANKANNALPTGVPWRLSADSVNRQLAKVATTKGS